MYFFLLLGVILIVVSIGLISAGGTGFGVFCLFLGLAITGFCIYGIIDRRKEINAENEAVALTDSINSEAKAIKSKYDQYDFLPAEFKSGLNVLIGILNGNLIIIPNDNNLHKSRVKSGVEKAFEMIIPINDIRYYLQTGEVTSNVSGYGGDSSFSLLTGFHGKTNPISINTTITDKKQTQLYYSVNGNDEMTAFMYDDYHKFKKLLPKHDFAIVNSLEIQNITNRENNNTQIEDRLTNLQSLKSKGLLTEDEYQEKRKKIIDNI